MFNIFLSIQSHSKSSLHPKLCPEPGGSLGYCRHCMPVPVASSRRRSDRAGTMSCCHRRHSLPCPSSARGTARQGMRAPGVDPKRVLHSHTCGSAGDDCSPSGTTPANATHTDAIEAVTLGKIGNWFPWFSPHFFAVFQLVPCLGTKPFLSLGSFFVCFDFTFWRGYLSLSDRNTKYTILKILQVNFLERKLNAFDKATMRWTSLTFQNISSHQKHLSQS